jgi:two-component system sensor histidine kinase YesM
MDGKAGIWFYIKNYKFNSIFIKNFLVIVLLLILPLTGMSVIVYSYYNRILEKEISVANARFLTNTRNNVDMIISETDKKLIAMTTDQYIQKFMLSYLSNMTQSEIFDMTRNMNNTINHFTLTNDYIDSVYIFSEKNDYIYSNKASGYSQKFFDKSWYEQYQNMKDKNRYGVYLRRSQSMSGDESGSYYMSFYRTCNPFDTKSVGVIVINTNMDKLRKSIDMAAEGYFEELFIIDGDGLLLYAKDTALLNKQMNGLDIFKDLPTLDKTGVVVKNLQGIKKVISITISEYNDWSYVYIVPLRQYETNIRIIYILMIAFIGTSIVSALAFSFIVSIRVYKPIKNIISLLQNPEEWGESLKISDGNRSDEFKYIAHKIMNTLDNSRKMEEELAYRMKLLKKAQSVALQSQINPHFLYNTLETINLRAICLLHGENEVSSMISSLSEFLRISLETSDNLITIKEEMRHAQNYVKILKVRYKDKFEFMWEMDDEILEYKIPKITFQPLIENAIYHGIKPMKGKGMITVKGHIDDNNIVVEVSDNGIGMKKELVHALNIELRNDYIKENEHIGICNVNQRIMLIYGEKYGLKVESIAGEGTRVMVVLPSAK